MGKQQWLNDEEQATWRSLMLTTMLLEEALDRQLQRDAGIPHAYYAILVTLSESPDRALRMSELAERMHYSQSRLTHAVTALERAGLVLRHRCPTDGRGQVATITDTGMTSLRPIAAGHVAEVRGLVFDHLTPDQVTQLGDICNTLLAGLDPIPRELNGPDSNG